MRTNHPLLLICAALMSLILGCSNDAPNSGELRHFPADNADGIIDQASVTADAAISDDGGGSLRIDAAAPMTVRLYKAGGLNIDGARIIYRAKLRTKDISGKVYLEMWCHFPGYGDYFSRDVEHPISGTTGWVTAETPFVLQKGQVLENVRMNLVIDGTGTVWIDDIHLVQVPLNP
jgi:hypothetical protein